MPPIPPEIRQETCTGCSLCARACPAFVLAMKEKKAIVSVPDWCIECGHCGSVCPVAAVTRQGKAPDPWPDPSAPSPVSPEQIERLIRERRSIRVHTSAPVPRSILERIIEVGRFTPTGSNSQGVRYIVLTDPKAIEELRRGVLSFYGKLFAKVMHPLWSRIMGLFVGRKTVVSLQDYGPRMAHAARLFESGEDPLFHKAPVILIAYSEKSDLSASFNGAAALYTCSLMAHALGLGCCFNGFLEAALNQKPSLRSLAGIPAGHRCTGAMTLGYPDIRYKRQVSRRSPEVIWR